MINSSCPSCRDRNCEEHRRVITLKENDIVVVEEPPGNPDIPRGTITEIINIGTETWSYYTSVGETTHGLSCYKRFRYATKREKFLYYILGPHVLEKLKN